MPALSLIIFVGIFLAFLAIGVLATKLNDPKFLAVIAGLMGGGLLGFFLAMLWAAWTGNIMASADDYENRKARLTCLLIIGCTGIIGGLIGLIRSLLRTRK